MKDVYSKEYAKRNNILHKAVYVLFIIYLVMGIQAQMISSNTNVYIMVICLVLSYIYEKIILSLDLFNRKKVYIISRYIEIIIYIVCMAIVKEDALIAYPIVGILLMLCYDFLLYDAIDDNLNRGTKLTMVFVPQFLSVIFLYGSPSQMSWAISIVLTLIAFLIVYYIVDYFYYFTNALNDKNLRLINKNSKLEDANNELIILRDKMKSVNEEINFHKISLSKINENLEQINYEIKSQNDVMKYMSSTFDILKCINVITESVMEVKKPEICAFYIREDVYMNKYPCVMINSNMSSMQKKLGKCIAKIYDEIKVSGNTLNIMETGILKGKYEFVGDSNIHAVSIFPLFNTEDIYGIMLIASKNKDFFESGTKYYESLVVEFNSVLKSTQLYLRMEDMARKDGLTGIYNRLYFNELFLKECKIAEENNLNLSVALFDIDKFKSINDTYGHLAGDEVIKMIADIDRETAEQYGGFACRYGGEEFLLVLPKTSAEVASAILESMHDRIKNTTIFYEGKEIHVNVSIGLTSYPELCASTDELIRRADSLMYYSKENGRGMLVVDGTCD